jgi:hypothetical protein
MIVTLNLIDNDGNKHEMPVPYSLEEINLSQYYDFQIAYDRMMREAEKVDNGEINSGERHESKVVELMIETCKIIVPKADLLDFNPNENITEYIETFKIIEGGDELTISLLYAHLFNIVRIYEPKHKDKVEFEYKGETYKIIAQELWRSWMMDPNYTQMSAGEYIWINEFKREKKKVDDQSFEQYGTMAFRVNLFMLAILARKEGEQLPYKESELREFVLNRAKHFQEVPASIALDVAFFLSHLIELYEKTPNSNIFTNKNPSHLKVAHRRKKSFKK